jgi:hypothetical protein
MYNVEIQNENVKAMRRVHMDLTIRKVLTRYLKKERTWRGATWQDRLNFPEFLNKSPIAFDHIIETKGNTSIHVDPRVINYAM